MFLQMADMGVSLVPLSKGFSLDSPICSMVIKTQEISTEKGMTSQTPY